MYMWKFRKNLCDNPNENHNLTLDELTDRVSSSVNNYASAFNVSVTVSITDKVQTWNGYVYKYTFTVDDKTRKGAKYIKCNHDPVTILSNVIIKRLEKMGMINNSGTVQVTDTVSVDYVITDVVPTNDGYLTKMTITYDSNNIDVVYVSNDLTNIDSDVQSAIITALVNVGVLDSFDVSVGYRVVE